MRVFARQMTERMKAVAAAGAVAAFWLAVWVFAAALVAQPFGACRGVRWFAGRNFVALAGVCPLGGSGAFVC